MRRASFAPLRRLTVAALAVSALLGCSGDSGPSGGQALWGVTVIDGLGNPPLSDQVVVIRDGLIADLAPTAGYDLPRSTQRVDLPGRFVIPGLVDAHAHVTLLPLDKDGALFDSMDAEDSARTLRTLLAFGVTSVRNPAAPAADGVALRERVRTGELLGPRLVTAGEALVRSGLSSGPFVATPDEEAARREVRRQAELGVDAIKLYTSLPPEVVAAAIEEAHAHGLRVVGHLQRTTWTEAARLGIDAVTHSSPWSAAYLPAAARDGYRGSLLDRLTWLETVDFDGPEIQDLISALAEGAVVVDPTLIAMHTKFWGDDRRHTQNPELHLAPEASRAIWRRSTFVDDWSAEDFARAKAAWPRLLELTRRLHEGGVTLAAGSDLPNPWVIPGVSLHQELGLLRDAGIPPLEVLQIATYNGAVALGREQEIGSIEVGKVADLLVLVGDPVALPTASRTISHVFLGGRYLDPAALLATLDEPAG